MQQLGVVVLGASGRTGSQVVKLLVDHPQARLLGACVSAGSASLGKAVPGHSLTFQVLSEGLLAQAQVVIDFSLPEGTAQLVQICASLKQGPSLLIASTGHSAEQIKAIEQAACKSPVLLCGNTSIGIAALLAASRLVQEILGPSFDLQIVEAHHRHKRDAPSGTARMLAGSLKRGGAEVSVPIASVRGGEVVGEHQILFMGPAERVELTHRAENREVFARGALSLSARLAAHPAGLYTLEEMYLPPEIRPSK